MSISSVFASEEYNEYVNTTYTDNFSMMLSGGVYTNFNLATIPGTSSGTGHKHCQQRRQLRLLPRQLNRDTSHPGH